MEDKASPQKTSSEAEKQTTELMILTLPQEKNWDGSTLYQYQGFWYPFVAAKAVISFKTTSKPMKLIYS
ncbi:hypothetical protein CRYUN_Cryun26dG0113300 [Craigia yunnanensis]